MYRLAMNGARVLHDKSATLGERQGVLIRVRSTFDDGEGSLIGPARSEAGRPALLGIALQGRGPEPVVVAALFAQGERRRHEAAVEGLGSEAGCARLPSEDPDAVLLGCPAASAGELARRLYSLLSPFSASV
jgi:hypothetical protein